jgi:uncharacterized membrane protein
MMLEHPMVLLPIKHIQLVVAQALFINGIRMERLCQVKLGQHTHLHQLQEIM